MLTRPVSSAAPIAVPLPPGPAGPPRAARLHPAPDRIVAGAAAPLRAATARAPKDPLSLAGLGACVEDARLAALRAELPPPDPEGFKELRGRIAAAARSLPPEYRRAVAEPLLAALDGLGARGLARLLAEDPAREGGAGLLLDVAQAVLQRGEGYAARPTRAFQEVVSDVYDGFLSDGAREGVKPPAHGVLPPLVRWGSAETGPYTWPVDATEVFGVKTAVVSLPAANASGGLLAWPALAHETAGHDVLGADPGLREELAGAVREGLLAEGMGPALAEYWADRIDEVASDVLGVLNMGPAAAVGLVGYFRAMNAAWDGPPALSSVGYEEDAHPADLARAYLAAETVRLLSFRGAARWADRLVAEADRDLGKIRLGGTAVTAGVAKASAAAVARVIVKTKLAALEGHSLGELQDWKDADEAVVAELRAALRAGAPSAAAKGAAGEYGEGAYAAHAVAAAVYEAASGGTPPAVAQARMIGVLAAMHERNATWREARAA